jgi:hypothetical protein
MVKLPDPEDLEAAEDGPGGARHDTQSVVRVRALNQELQQYQQRVSSLHSSIRSRDPSLGQDALRASNPGAMSKAKAAPSPGGTIMRSGHRSRGALSTLTELGGRHGDHAQVHRSFP